MLHCSCSTYQETHFLGHIDSDCFFIFIHLDPSGCKPYKTTNLETCKLKSLWRTLDEVVMKFNSVNWVVSAVVVHTAQDRGELK